MEEQKGWGTVTYIGKGRNFKKMMLKTTYSGFLGVEYGRHVGLSSSRLHEGERGVVGVWEQGCCLHATERRMQSACHRLPQVGPQVFLLAFYSQL